MGQVREPNQWVNYQDQDKRTLVMVGIPLHVENTTIEQDIKKQHNINLKATRMINSKTQKPTCKFKPTLERESDKKNIGNRLLGYTIESYRRKTYRCTASDPKCANCFGPNASSDRSCPKFQEIIKMLDQRQYRQVSRAHQVLNKTHQIRGVLSNTSNHRNNRE